MRDETTFVEWVRRDLRDVRWPEPAELRARARRRSRRAAVGAASAVLVVVSASAVAAAGHGGQPAPPPVAAPVAPEPSVPARTEIPREVLVQPGDLAAKTDPPLGRAGFGESVRLVDMLLYCHKIQGHQAEWETASYSRSQTLLRDRPDGYDHPSADVLLSQDVYRVAQDVAGRLLPGIDRMLVACADWRATGQTEWQGRTIKAEVVHRWEVRERNFAGDEAVLLRHSITEARNVATGKPLSDLPKPELTAVVRVGDLVTVVTLGRDGVEAELRRVAVAAARRLCAAANPTC
ncbi:hypothetical protein NCC78_23715 [Micromonospora phytophila]|uniref:hypothetical protein n=1 Tax=Micromonospora phytophila TaxID=709888 RepID=UPI00202EC875|nr:hypothetical protein [Micromonospora phytophila]MCM0677672.1 hypothetical protein [Micromonospora phytophila]